MNTWQIKKKKIANSYISLVKDKKYKRLINKSLTMYSNKVYIWKSKIENDLRIYVLLKKTEKTRLIYQADLTLKI